MLFAVLGPLLVLASSALAVPGHYTTTAKTVATTSTQICHSNSVATSISLSKTIETKRETKTSKSTTSTRSTTVTSKTKSTTDVKTTPSSVKTTATSKKTTITTATTTKSTAKSASPTTNKSSTLVTKAPSGNVSKISRPTAAPTATGPVRQCVTSKNQAFNVYSEAAIALGGGIEQFGRLFNSNAASCQLSCAGYDACTAYDVQASSGECRLYMTNDPKTSASQAFLYNTRPAPGFTAGIYDGSCSTVSSTSPLKTTTSASSGPVTTCVATDTVTATPCPTASPCVTTQGVIVKIYSNAQVRGNLVTINSQPSDNAASCREFGAGFPLVAAYAYVSSTKVCNFYESLSVFNRSAAAEYTVEPAAGIESGIYFDSCSSGVAVATTSRMM